MIDTNKINEYTYKMGYHSQELARLMAFLIKEMANTARSISEEDIKGGLECLKARDMRNNELCNFTKEEKERENRKIEKFYNDLYEQYTASLDKKSIVVEIGKR